MANGHETETPFEMGVSGNEAVNYVPERKPGNT